jgi:hypothetical protein
MAHANHQGPRSLSQILGDLFTLRGYGRVKALSELEELWKHTVGEPKCYETCVGEMRRGVLTVIVAHPTLLEELASFHKPALLQALQASHVGRTIRDLRFRVGPVDLLDGGEARPSTGKLSTPRAGQPDRPLR